MKTSVEQIEALRYTLHMFGVPIKCPTMSFVTTKLCSTTQQTLNQLIKKYILGYAINDAGRQLLPK